MLYHSTMPAIRSSARIAATSARLTNITVSNTSSEGATAGPKRKRRLSEEIPKQPGIQKKVRKLAVTPQTTAPLVPVTGEGRTSPLNGESSDSVVPAVLTFSLDEAKKHLISVDHRFEDIFNKLLCKPYENLESFHPFQSVCSCHCLICNN